MFELIIRKMCFIHFDSNRKLTNWGVKSSNLPSMKLMILLNKLLAKDKLLYLQIDDNSDIFANNNGVGQSLTSRG